jgi:hypothetical protein
MVMKINPSKMRLANLFAAAMLGFGSLAVQAHDYDDYYQPPHRHGWHRPYWPPPPPPYVIGPPAYMPPPIYVPPPSITIGIPPFVPGIGFYPPPYRWHGGHHGWHH